MRINGVTINGTTAVTLNKPIYTGGTGNTISITANSGNGDVTLATGTIVLDSLDGGGGNGNITITGSVKGGQDLDILSQVAGQNHWKYRCWRSSYKFRYKQYRR